MGITDRKCLFLIAFGSFLTFIQPSSGEKSNTCLAPPQPHNGNRKLVNLESLILSEVEEGTELPIESSLKYECNPGYIVFGSSIATCESNGKWFNIPICRVCGIPPNVESISVNGTLVDIYFIPWHASLYIQKTTDGSKDFICGATIINENLLLTAAHCVYDNLNRKADYINKYYITTGNIYREFNSTLSDDLYNPRDMKIFITSVKYIYINTRYMGFERYFAGDIAILEIETPFVFSNLVYPVCLEDISLNLYNGMVASFLIDNSGLRNYSIYYSLYDDATYDQCQFSNDSLEFEMYKARDKLCARYKNGNLNCGGIDGAGLVFRGKFTYYLRGIFSIPLKPIRRDNSVTCNSPSYSLLTSISSYISWIQERVLQIETFKRLSSSRRPTVINTTPTPAPIIPHSQSTTTTSSPWITKPIICTAPPQPANGNRQLHKSQCQSQKDCDVQEGAQLHAGTFLDYNCYHGYKISDVRDTFCSSKGQWINIPICIEIHCDSLVSKSTSADCTYNDEWTSCEFAVKPGTIAKLSCRNGYKKDSTILSTQTDQVRCNEEGQWTPDPIKCIPVCGYVRTLYAKPFIVNGMDVEFVPWHATLYEMKRLNGPKEFTCGATIITENFLVTAAHCVFDETVSRVKDSRKYYVATGNTDRDYDFENHDLRFVKKARVKHIYVHCNYLGSLGNYAYDIALLEIEVPFVFTHMLLPACLDGTIIESGLGIVAGFGYTASGSSSTLLQLTTLPYVSNSQCKAINNSFIYEQLITSDKFCAGYTNGTSICDGDSGGGILFKVGDLWFLRGIANSGISVKLEGGNVVCDNRSYSLYIRIAYYLSWMQGIIYKTQPTEFLCIK